MCVEDFRNVAFDRHWCVERLFLFSILNEFESGRFKLNSMRQLKKKLYFCNFFCKLVCPESGVRATGKG